ncbi:helix-turn-helix domain-containing protein [Sunxiuqinia dokdonensis]|uniref:Adenylate cyclase n=1 Tax=Sunxiuqinia dokdonensis TaxID=1409788 RepID=A0A0L8VA64_9BACT|nr:helix-turn-helix domain-containing protein [Sunxiuqinia dokdonensis]KOH45346.1 adenylate cyclase [Sunxiuqinia dokdonensis]
MNAEKYSPPSTEVKSIAVLPFVNMSADVENEYFSDGITEEIINALTRIEGLKVIARTSSFSFKGKNIDVREIGRQLVVSAVLEGSVRKVQNRVRITAQLINAADGTHFWSKNFDRNLEDIFELQDEISLLIANQIRENFGHFNIQEHLVGKPTKNMQAYELYLKGHFYQLKWDADSIREATKYYEASVALDPGFARAYYGLVQSYGLLAAWGYMPAEEGFSKATHNFMIAADIDKSLPEYGMSFVGRTFWKNWDFQPTYTQLCETLELYPKYTDALEAMAELFLAHGYWPQAEEYIRRAMDVDPLSANHYYTLANINYYQRKFELALELVEKALYINPEFVLAYELKTLCLIWLNQKDIFEAFISDHENAATKRLLFKVINGSKKVLPSATIEEWREVAKDERQMVPYELFILANANHKEEAFELLKEYIEQKRGQIINFRQDPSLEPLREFDGFAKLHCSNFEYQEVEKVSTDKTADSKPSRSELDVQMKKLMDFIDAEKPFLDAQLNLSRLAGSVQLHPNRLSFLINEKTGMNFNEFVNQFRLAHFKEIAVDDKNAHITILGLAYESGFNSKTVFNAYFKKIENTTPGIWLKQARQ